MNKNLIIFALVVISVGLPLSAWQGYRFGVRSEILRSAELVASVNIKNMEKQKALFKAIEDVAEDAEKERANIEFQLAGADASVDRLREIIRRADARSGSGTTGVTDATAARSSLAECAAKYRDLGRQHDRLRAVVIGLQSYAREVSK